MTQASYVRGNSAPPLIGDTIGAYFDKIVDRFGESEALVARHQNLRWTYRQLRRRVDNLASNLAWLGLEPGDRIGIWSQNNAQWLLIQLASAKAGLILVNLNPAYQRNELKYALNKVQCKALIVARGFRGNDYLAMLHELAPELSTSAAGFLASAALPSLRLVITLDDARMPGVRTFDELLVDASTDDLARLAALGARLQCDDPINIQFTSGTTGAPKAATLTHHNILNNAFFVGQAMNFSEHDRLCIPVPLFHIFGMVLGNLVCATHGAAMVYPGESFDAKAVLEAVESERCTALHGVPTMFIALLEHPEFDAGGWMHTGDLATLDAEGYCNIVGRSKDMVIRGGENISPREVEEFLHRHPKVLDVQVIGLPDAKYGEELCACIVLRPGATCSAEDIRSFCRGEIAHFKVPRHVHFLREFPLTVSGKVQKFVLREQMARALDVDEEEVTA